MEVRQAPSRSPHPRRDARIDAGVRRSPGCLLLKRRMVSQDPVFAESRGGAGRGVGAAVGARTASGTEVGQLGAPRHPTYATATAATYLRWRRAASHPPVGAPVQFSAESWTRIERSNSARRRSGIRPRCVAAAPVSNLLRAPRRDGAFGSPARRIGVSETALRSCEYGSCRRGGGLCAVEAWAAHRAPRPARRTTGWGISVIAAPGARYDGNRCRHSLRGRIRRLPRRRQDAADARSWPQECRGQGTRGLAQPGEALRRRAGSTPVAGLLDRSRRLLDA